MFLFLLLKPGLLDHVLMIEKLLSAVVSPFGDPIDDVADKHKSTFPIDVRAVRLSC